MDTARFTSLAGQFPEQIRLGTSSWTYPGWQGLLYKKEYKSEAAFKRECLQEYAHCGLFQSAGLDSSFYGPPSKTLLERYKSQIPPSFQFLIKAWEEISIPQYANIKRYGAKAGAKNENFLSTAALDAFLTPFFRSGFLPHIGVIVFQFQQLRSMSNQTFLEALHPFLLALPKEIRFAVEVRNEDLLCADYFSILNEAGVTHCFNHWTAMPELHEQMRAAAEAGGLNAPFFASRILTPRGVSYGQAVKRFSPYAKLQAALPQMRKDVLRLVRRALERNVPAYVIVNNRAEGCSPLSIERIRQMIQESLSESQA